MLLRTLLGLLTVALSAALLRAADEDPAHLRNWPQWRGPLADGTAPLGDPPLEWSETKNVRWTAEIPGRGSATPIVWEDRVFVLTAVGTGRSPDRDGLRAGRPATPEGPNARFGALPPPDDVHEFTVLCYDRRTGRKLWERIAAEGVPHEGGHQTNTFASGSPTTDGESLYVSFGSFGVYSYDLDGHPRWKRDLGRMETRRGFGEGASPALHGDTLVITWDHEGDSFIVALDSATGETRWKRDRDEQTTWATPLVVEHDGRAQVVTHGANRVRSYDLQTGELIWECGGQAANPIASPVRLDDLTFLTTGYQGFAVYAIPLGARGDLTDSDRVAWRRSDTGSYISSPLLYDGRLYVTKARDAVLFSLDARTGEELIGQTRIPGLSTLYASPVAAAGRIYFTDRNGATTVLRHGPVLEVLATNTLDEGIDASAALVASELFLRTERRLYCIADQESRP